MDTNKFVHLEEAVREPYISFHMLKELTIMSGRIPFYWDGLDILVRIKDVERFFTNLIERLNCGDLVSYCEDDNLVHPTPYQMLTDEIGFWD